MTDKKNKGTDPKHTNLIHLAYMPLSTSQNAGSRQVPIYQTTSYLFDDV